MVPQIEQSRTVTNLHKSKTRRKCLKSLGTGYETNKQDLLSIMFELDLALINRTGGLNGRILTEVVSTDRMQ